MKNIIITPSHFSLAADSTNSGGSSTGGGGFAETDFSSASCGSSIDAAGVLGPANTSSSVMANVGGDHQLVRVWKMLTINKILMYILQLINVFHNIDKCYRCHVSHLCNLFMYTDWKL